MAVGHRLQALQNWLTAGLSLNLRLLAIIALLTTAPHIPVGSQRYAQNLARAEAYLVQHFNPILGLVYESDDAGQHWLGREFPNFRWHYNQTYWLFSDNFFAYLALQQDYPQVSNRIRAAIESYGQPAPNFFEVVGGRRIHLPLHDATDIIVDQNASYVVMIRTHNSTRLALGNYVDFWMYEGLEYALQGNLANAVLLVHRAEALWRGNGLEDWSFTIFDHMFSNQKLALLLFTARAIGVGLIDEEEMEAHLWSMQNEDGGIASLSDLSGTRAGSSNAETTALTILVYDPALLSQFPKAEPQTDLQTLGGTILLVAIAALLFVPLVRKRGARRLSSLGVECTRTL
jgi:hypothetical protein